MTLPRFHRPKIDRGDVPDALFPTDNEFGIPSLSLDGQAEYCHLPVVTWGSVKRNQTMPGTWHFYTDDYRFDAIWQDTSPVINSQCVAAVECNFTTSEQMPAAVAIWQIYRKRWLAKFWQSQGIKIFVDLNVSYDLAELNLLGVPRGWRSYMTRGYSEYLEQIDDEYLVAKEHCGGDPIFCVYGGGERVKRHCFYHDYIWVPETMDVAKGKYTNG